MHGNSLASIALSLLAVGLCTTAVADDGDSGEPMPLDEIATELMNPIGGLTSLANNFDYRTFQGSLPEAGDQTQWRYTLTPVVPIALSGGSRLVLRMSIPISFSTPTFVTEERDHAEFLIRQRADSLASSGGNFIDGHGHLDDVTWDVAWGRTRDSGLFTMVGLAGSFPTSQDFSIARHQYLLGPEFAVGKVYDWGIFGAWAKHLVDVAGGLPVWETEGYDTSETSVRLIFAWGLGNGWQIVSNPEIVYDWEAAPDNELLLPLGGGVSKTFRIGRVPMKMDLEAYSYIESPDAFGPDWQLNFRITPLLPNWFGD